MLALRDVRPDHPVLTRAVLRMLLLISSVLSVPIAVGRAVKPFPEILSVLSDVSPVVVVREDIFTFVALLLLLRLSDVSAVHPDPLKVVRRLLLISSVVRDAFVPKLLPILLTRLLLTLSVLRFGR